MRYPSIILIFILGAIISCVDPLDITIDKEVNILIVEGAITTQPGPHQIRLTRSAKYGSIFDGYIRSVTGAKVFIRDSDGTNFYLTEDPDFDGIYKTEADFIPVVGKSYTLLIKTPEGKDFTSLPEEILPASGITELSSQYQSTPTNTPVDQTGLNVLATYQDSPGERNYYMWKSNGTYKIETYPENYTARDPLGGPSIIPAPKDCCRDCWVDEVGTKTIRIVGDNNVDGNLVSSIATYVEDDGIRFTEKYLVRVEQHSLTTEAYQFFKLLKDQASINGDIFDPPPATLRGNMINLTDPDENVIGYFRASDVAIDSMFLTRDMLVEPKPLIQINDDCREYESGIAERPDYW